jgi:putative peptide zinc metalloprotease protein
MPADRPYPRFRRDIVVRRVVESGDAAWTVHDPLRNAYFRHDTLTHEVCELLDGRRDAEEVIAELHDKYPQYSFTREWVDELVDDLRRAGFLEDTFSMNEMQRARAREARRKWAPTSLKNVLNVQFGVVDPTPAFRLLYPLVRFMFTKAFVIASVIAFFVACGLVWDRRETLVQGMATIFTLANSGWLGILVLWVILFLIVVAHEFGHGLCCMHYGGQPRRLGFMMFYLMPGMFCDVSDIYFFEKRWHRAAVALAGGFVEILCFTVATFVWVATPPDLVIHEIAFKVLLFSGATGLIFNYNPLIKLDGYYVLMSWLDMPDLRERSFAYLGQWFRRTILRLPADPGRTTRRERRAFVIYGVTAMLYSISYTWLMLLFVRGVLVSNFREAGMAVFLLFFFLTTKKYWVRLAAGARYLAIEKGGFVRRHAAASAAVAALLVLAAIVPFPHAVTVEARLAPAERGLVTAPFDGTVREVFARSGAEVGAGAVLAIVAPIDAGAEGPRGAARAQAEAAEARLRRDARDPALRAAAPLARAGAALADARETRGWLAAPVAGRVLTAHPASLVGRRVAAGEPLLEVGATDELAVLFVAGERAVGDLIPGETADLRLRAAPGRRLRVALESIDPAPAGRATGSLPPATLVDDARAARRFVGRGRIANADGALRPGMSGRARIASRPLNLVQRAGRTYARLVRADFWL